MSVFANVTSLPFAFTSFSTGRRSRPAAARCFGSSTSTEDRPVTSSTCDCTVTPSTKSLKRMKPATSVTTGWVCGSQFATIWPGCTALPSSATMVAP